MHPRRSRFPRTVLIFLSLICGCEQRRGSSNDSFHVASKILRPERRRRALLRDQAEGVAKFAERIEGRGCAEKGKSA